MPSTIRTENSSLALSNVFAAVCAALAIFLFGLNFYGEIKTMRLVDNIPSSDFKFENDISLDISETLEQIKRRKQETDLEFSFRLTTVVQQSIGHLDTWFTASPDYYPQRVPMRENIWLHLMSYLFKDTEVVKYHFANYRKTLERGIGICGDHAYMLSQILWDNDIPNSILVFTPHKDHLSEGGHVLVEVRPENDASYLLDADFGVIIPNEKLSAESRHSLITRQFMNAGYLKDQSTMLADILGGEMTEFSSTWDIMKKRYIFEVASYKIKWLLPIVLLAIFLCSPLRKKLIPLTSVKQKARD